MKGAGSPRSFRAFFKGENIMTNPFTPLAYKVMALILSLMASWGMISTPSQEIPIVVDENAQLSFVVWGDPQVSNVLFEREGNLKSACEDLGNTEGQLDALVIVGDIAENGLQSEYDTVRDMLNTAGNSFNNFICLEGNHDVRNKIYSSQLKRFQSFNNSVSNAVPMKGNHYNYSYEINGYKFIVMGTDTTQFEESDISAAQLKWLDEEIASTQGTGKPVFVLNHQPLQNTHGLPGTWNAPKFLKAGSVGKQSDDIKAIFEKYNNVIFITGHLHTGIGQYSYEDYGSFKSINVPSVCIKNADGVDGTTQGYVFSVYGDKLVAKARVFGDGKYVDESVQNAVIEIPFNY